jgi:hypothetical protein
MCESSDLRFLGGDGLGSVSLQGGMFVLQVGEFFAYGRERISERAQVAVGFPLKTYMD